MKVEIINYHDHWQAVKDAAMNTIGKGDGKYPSDAWKRKILLAEHSPIRLLEFTIRFTDIPYWQVMQIVRHHEGCSHFVSTQRTDRTGVDRTKLTQDALISYTLVCNAQALINISRKRLCSQAAPETRQAWMQVIKAVREVEPIVASVCVKECVYRGHCPEMRSCGYTQNGAFELEKQAYRAGVAIAVEPEKA